MTVKGVPLLCELVAMQIKDLIIRLQSFNPEALVAVDLMDYHPDYVNINNVTDSVGDEGRCVCIRLGNTIRACDMPAK